MPEELIIIVHFRANETLFFGLDQAREAVARWVADYNQHRPHSALGYTTPVA